MSGSSCSISSRRDTSRGAARGQESGLQPALTTLSLSLSLGKLLMVEQQLGHPRHGDQLAADRTGHNRSRWVSTDIGNQVGRIAGSEITFDSAGRNTLDPARFKLSRPRAGFAGQMIPAPGCLTV